MFEYAIGFGLIRFISEHHYGGTHTADTFVGHDTWVAIDSSWETLVVPGILSSQRLIRVCGECCHLTIRDGDTQNGVHFSRGQVACGSYGLPFVWKFGFLDCDPGVGPGERARWGKCRCVEYCSELLPFPASFGVPGVGFICLCFWSFALWFVFITCCIGITGRWAA